MTARLPFNFTHASMGYAAIQRIQPRIAEELKLRFRRQPVSNLLATLDVALLKSRVLLHARRATECQREEQFGYKPCLRAAW